MVQEIERLEPELQISLLRKEKALQDGEIPNKDSWADDRVAPSITVSAERLQRERIDIEPFTRAWTVERGTNAGRIGAVVAGGGLRASSSVPNRQLFCYRSLG